MRSIRAPLCLVLFLALANLACIGSTSTSPLPLLQPTGTAPNATPRTAPDTTVPPPKPPAPPLPIPRATPTNTIPVPEVEKPLALIYKGPGSCSVAEGDAGTTGYGCSEADADVATAAGFRFQYVGPDDFSDQLFLTAKVWIQPGGLADTAYDAMSSNLRSGLVRFISDGGGYVGFCSGAFLAAEWFHIFPGSADFFWYYPARWDVEYGFEKLIWNGKTRYVYIEGGPYLYDLGPTVEITARFKTGEVAAARAPFGNGRVYLSGPHPDAPQVWSQEDGLKDPDGSDIDLAAEMVRWAAKLE